MGSLQRQASSGSGSDSGTRDAVIDDRKRKRMESNRVSARRSRLRKQKQMEELIGQVTQLQTANADLAAKINVTTQNYVEFESKNNVLRAQMMELTDRLQSLNSVLQIIEAASGIDLDIPEIIDPFMKQPWQVPIPNQPILANVDMFEF